MEKVIDLKLEENAPVVEVIATAKKTVARKPAAKKVTTVKATALKKVAQKDATVKASQKKIVESKATGTIFNETSNEIKKTVSSTVNDITKKVDFTKNVGKVKSSVKSLNDQVKSSASVIYNEVVDMNKEIADIAIKGVKEITSNFDIKVEVEKMKTDAMELNEKAIQKVKGLNSQVTAKSEEFKSNTSKLANQVLENIKVTEILSTAKDFVKNSNKYTLEGTENAIDLVEKNTIEWQKLTEKAMKKGFKLASKQQELVFETLEEVKAQVKTTRNNFKKLFSSVEA